MNISYSRYDAFWRNPERYRLHYGHHLEPDEKEAPLARGTVYHALRHAHATQMNFQVGAQAVEEVYKKLTAKGIGAQHWQAGLVLFNAWLQYAPQGIPGNLLASEVGFEAEIEGSHHKLIGIIDRIVEINGEVWVLEDKHANGKKRYADLQEQWEKGLQADFELLGAQALGHQPAGMRVCYLIDSKPHKYWEIQVLRSPERLEATLQQVIRTGDMIEWYLEQYGVEEPWPHLNISWPCMSPDKCPYSPICDKPLKLGEIPPGFTQYKEKEMLFAAWQPDIKLAVKK